MVIVGWETTAWTSHTPVPHPVSLHLLNLPVLLIKSAVTWEQWMVVGRETTALLHQLAVHKTMEQLRMEAGWGLFHHSIIWVSICLSCYV